MSWDQTSQEDARLVILAELAKQTDESLNSVSLGRVIDAMSIRRPKEWVESQIAWLESMGAVSSRSVELPGLGKVVVATLTGIGRDHVERRTRLSGVSAPAGL